MAEWIRYPATSFCFGLGWITRENCAVRFSYEELLIIKCFFHGHFSVERLKSKRVTEIKLQLSRRVDWPSFVTIIRNKPNLDVLDFFEDEEEVFVV